jgi:hypothetical protein
VPHPEIPGFTGINVSISLDWLDENQDYSKYLKELIEPYIEERITRMGPGTCEMA